MIELRRSTGCDLTTKPIPVASSLFVCADNSGVRTDSGYHGIGSATASRVVLSMTRDPHKMPRPMHVGTENHPHDPRQSEPFTGMLCLDHRTENHLQQSTISKLYGGFR